MTRIITKKRTEQNDSSKNFKILRKISFLCKRETYAITDITSSYYWNLKTRCYRFFPYSIKYQVFQSRKKHNKKISNKKIKSYLYL